MTAVVCSFKLKKKKGMDLIQAFLSWSFLSFPNVSFSVFILTWYVVITILYLCSLEWLVYHTTFSFHGLLEMSAPVYWELLFFLRFPSQSYRILWSSGLFHPIQADFVSSFLGGFCFLGFFPPATLASYLLTLVPRPILTRNHLWKFASTTWNRRRHQMNSMYRIAQLQFPSHLNPKSLLPTRCQIRSDKGCVEGYMYLQVTATPTHLDGIHCLGLCFSLNSFWHSTLSHWKIPWNLICICIPSNFSDLVLQVPTNSSPLQIFLSCEACCYH